MKRLFKWLGIGIAVPALLAAGLYGIYWYKVKSYVDEYVHKLSPFADISYASVYVNPLGEVGLQNVKIVDKFFHIPVEIGSLTAKSKDPFIFLKLPEKFTPETIPPMVGFSIEHLKVSLDNAELVNAGRRLAKIQKENITWGGEGVQACGDTDVVTVDVMRAMGYHQIDMSISASLEWIYETKELTVETFSEAELMGDGSSKVAMRIVDNKPRIQQIHWNYNDIAYNARLANYCAKETGIDRKDYLTHVRAALESEFKALGATVPQTIIDAWVQAYTPRVKMEGRFLPAQGIGTDIAIYMQKPSGLIEYLNPSLMVNQQPVDLTTLDWTWLDDAINTVATGRYVRPKAGSVAVQASDSAQQSVQPEAKKEGATAISSSGEAVDLDAYLERMLDRKGPTEHRKQYRAVEVAKLHQFEGKRVRGLTNMGNLFEGRLIDVKDSAIKVEQRVEHGTAIYPLTFSQVRSIEVYH